MAEPPCTLMSAPIRLSSGTCMKRFSKMVSVIIEAPSATVISAMNCACRSVAKPGKGSVITSTPLQPVQPARRGGRALGHHLHPGFPQLAGDGAEMLGRRAPQQHRRRR